MELRRAIPIKLLAAGPTDFHLAVLRYFAAWCVSERSVSNVLGVLRDGLLSAKRHPW